MSHDHVTVGGSFRVTSVFVSLVRTFWGATVKSSLK